MAYWMNQKWDGRYLRVAAEVSTWSKDPSTKVGAVITRPDNSLVSVGFNGFSKGVEDTEERLNNRELKYKMIVHGEIHALAYANQPVHGCTLYTHPFMPCSVCAAIVVDFGIKRVVAPWSSNERWVASFELTRMIFKEAGVELVEVNAPTIITEPTMTEKESKSIAELNAELAALKNLRNSDTYKSAKNIDDQINETEAILSKRLTENRQLLKG